ncbi:MAG: DUF1579 domain-containing protein [Candidatus Zixiibacteriota bacterium]|nr:MAG: DUF1579 domain-containing protein [candidate division Zixibacteria bacterium]
MESRHTLIGFALLVLTVLVSGALAQEGAPSQEEMEAKWEKYATPGESHQLLDQFTGQWDLVMRWWMDPSAPPSEEKATADVQWILGDRFLREDVSGTMMGQPFQGFHTIGYDNFKEKYLFSWIDNTSTGMTTGEGTYDPAKKEITYTGVMDDYMTGERNKPIRYVTRIVDRDKRVFEFHDQSRGEQSKMGEIIYTRRK